MASMSEVKAALDGIAEKIASSQTQLTSAKSSILSARNALANLPTQYADAISTIDGYTPTGAFETLAKDEKAKLQTEFVALKNSLETILTYLGVNYS